MIFHQIAEWWRARQRGEVRIAPYGTRGRVYVKKDGEPQGSGVQLAKAEPKATISARVYRAATDTWEDRGIISGPPEE